MCIKHIKESDNVRRVIGNPTSQEAYVRTNLLSVMGDYAMLTEEATKLSKPVTYTITNGEDKGEYVLRKGVPARLRAKIERLNKLAWEVAADIESLPRSASNG